MIWFILIIAVVLAVMFPAYLIDAIKIQDEQTAKDKKERACLIFGGLVFIVMILLISGL